MAMAAVKAVHVAEVEPPDPHRALVGDHEADVKSGLISISSPIARGLIGKSAGDVVEAEIEQLYSRPLSPVLPPEL